MICKAADAGFNFIVVLAGILNNLRSQTQSRIDEGFLGFDTQYERAYNINNTTKIGVGLIPGFDLLLLIPIQQVWTLEISIVGQQIQLGSTPMHHNPLFW